MNTTLLAQRTRVAVELHADDLDPVPDDATIEQCRALCAKIGVCPEELCDDTSQAWSTIQLLQALKQGSAAFSFRGTASPTLAAQLAQTVRAEA